MSYEAEFARLLANVIMLGVVSELDETGARVRVDADGLRTDWIPWGERRAGPGARTWAPPGVGEQVIIACPYGDPSQAVVLASVYQDAYSAPADQSTLHRTAYPDGTVIEYDSSARRLTVNAGAGEVHIHCSTARVVASQVVELDTPSVRITGDLQVDGSGSVQGSMSVQGDVSSQGEVWAENIGLKAHHHTAQGATAPTTSAQP